MTKFQATEDALASVSDDGIVTGIYSPEGLFYRAVFEDNVDLMKKLLPLIDKNIVVNHDFDGKQLFSRGTNEILKEVGFEIYNKLVTRFESQEKFTEVLISNKWDKVKKYLDVNRGEIFCSRSVLLIQRYSIGTDIVSRLVFLIYSKKPEAINIVKSYYTKVGTVAKEILMRAMIQTGGEEGVVWMSQYLPEIFIFNRDLYQNSNINDPTQFRSDFYNPLIDAYFGGNLNLINRFKKLGYDNEEIQKFYSLSLVIGKGSQIL